MSTVVEEAVEVISKEEKNLRIILYNDDYNTFQHVAECLMKYCDHTAIQAEQCAWIVHYNGKTDVKSGDFDTLEPIHRALNDNGLTARIE